MDILRVSKINKESGLSLLTQRIKWAFSSCVFGHTFSASRNDDRKKGDRSCRAEIPRDTRYQAGAKASIDDVTPGPRGNLAFGRGCR